MRRLTSGGLLSVVVLGGAFAGAAPRAFPQARQAVASSQDSAFLKQAMMDNRAAIDEGNMILQKSNNDQLKQIAQTVIDTHTKLLERLEKESSTIGTPVPSGAGPAAEQVGRKLKALHGEALDRQFIHNMIQLHRAELHAYQAEATNGQDQTLKMLSQDEVPILRHHLDDLLNLQKEAAGRVHPA